MIKVTISKQEILETFHLPLGVELEIVDVMPESMSPREITHPILPKTIIVDFPKMNLKEIFKKSKGKTEKGSPLVWNFDVNWVRNEPFFTEEYTSPGKKVIDLEIIGLGKTWQECKDLAEKNGKRMLNFAELVYLYWKYEDEVRPLIENNWTWVSTKPVIANLGYSGGWDSDGPCLSRDVAGISYSYLGVGFSCMDYVQ